MIIEVDDKLISKDIFDQKFNCDLSACKGACCVKGDAGAPLTWDEVDTIKHYLNEIKPFMDKVDLVLVMSVEPGFGGQGYIENSTARISKIKRYLKDNCLERVQIQVDGGIKLHNAKEVISAGGDILVAGSEVFGSKNPSQVIRDFYANAHSIQ